MKITPGFRSILLAGVGLCGGITLGALIPSAGDATTKNTERSTATVGPGVEKGDQSGNSAELGTGGDAGAVKDVSGQRNLRGAIDPGAEGALGKLPPEKLVALFERISNLKSDSRKYILAYRIASQLDKDQIEGALKAALQDLSDGDYVTTRALGRRWAEIDPKSAAAKAFELKQQHLLVPVLESWSRLDPAGPLQWALEQDGSTKIDATRQLLAGRMLAPDQLQKLVVTAADSNVDAMRTQIFPFATARLAESNPQGALHAAASIDDADLRQRTIGMVLGRIAQNSPEVGKAWLAAQPDLTPQERSNYEQILANPRPQRRGGQ
jgi:hypothetical protein